MGVVEYDRQLGGGVPSVKSERRWEEECAVSEYVSLYRVGNFIGFSRQRLAKSASKEPSFDGCNIVRSYVFVQCDMGMDDMRRSHGCTTFLYSL